MFSIRNARNCFDSIRRPMTKSISRISSNQEIKLLSNRQELTLAKQWADLRTPRASMISQWLKVNADRSATGGTGTSGNEMCFVDSWPRPNILVAIDFLKSYGTDRFPKMTVFTDYGVHTTHADEMERFLDEVIRAADLSREGGIEIRALFPEWKPLLDRLFIERLGMREKNVWPCRAYWLPEEERDWLRQHAPRPPRGFEFDTLREDETEFVDDTWEFRVKGATADLIRRQIRHFPNACLRETNDKDGQDKRRLAAWMMVEAEVGLMSHLYTMPEFRRRGFGTLVESKLAHTLIRKGHTPVKAVVRDNRDGVAVSNASPLWKYVGDCLWIFYGNEKMIKAFEEAKKK